MIKIILTIIPFFVVSSVAANNTVESENVTSVTGEITALSQPAPSQRIDKTDPYLMIQKVAEKTFKRFADEQSSIQQQPNILKTIVREELMPYINYKYSAYKVIGARNFKKTTETERKAFVPVFRDYLISSYAQVFTLYKKQKVTFEPPRPITNEKIVSVNTAVIEPGRDPINISFRVRKNNKTNDWKAYDMVAEGVSLLDSKQAELSSIIRQKGLPHVT